MAIIRSAEGNGMGLLGHLLTVGQSGAQNRDAVDLLDNGGKKTSLQPKGEDRMVARVEEQVAVRGGWSVAEVLRKGAREAIRALRVALHGQTRRRLRATRPETGP